EGRRLGYRQTTPWFRLHLGQHDWREALKIADGLRRGDGDTGSYMAALVYLKQRDTVKAAAEVELLRNAAEKHKNNRQIEARLWETDGWLKCQMGDADEGLKLLAKLVERTKNDYSHHAWGNGAVYMETWGIAALQAGRLAEAEEAFQEALAHDLGSV